MLSDRMRKILHICIQRDTFITGSELCDVLGVSTRTIRSDIRDLNRTLKTQGALIISEKRSGYRLSIIDAHCFEQYLNRISNFAENDVLIFHRVKYIVTILVLNEIRGIKAITLNELATQCNISLTSLKNDLKRVKIELNRFHLMIEKTGNKGICIVGEEENIRDFIHFSLMDENWRMRDALYAMFEKVFSTDITVIDSLLRSILKKFDFRLSDIAYNDLVFSLIITLLRIRQQKYVLYKRKVREKLASEVKIQIAKEIGLKVSRLLQDVILFEDELLYITKYVITGSYFQENSNGEYTLLENEYIVQKVLDQIERTFQLNLASDKVLIQFLGNHLSTAINKATYGIKVKNSMLGVIKNNYPFAVELALLTNTVLEEEIAITLTEDDIGFVALHFAAALTRKKEQQDETVKKVVIICTTGMGTSLLLKVKLESYFKQRVHIIDTISAYEWNDKNMESVDLIVTTIDLNLQDDRVVCVKGLLNKDDMKRIEDKIRINPKRSQLLLNKLNEHLFFPHIECESKQQVLEFMTQRLRLSGNITPKICNRIFERERISSTEIGSLVAIPHDMSEEISESFIAIATLKRKISWNTEPVQVVIFIGIAMKDKFELKSCLERLYANITERETIVKILKCTNYTELIEVIKTF